MERFSAFEQNKEKSPKNRSRLGTMIKRKQKESDGTERRNEKEAKTEREVEDDLVWIPGITKSETGTKVDGL
jgi:hypothetical protein